MCGLRTDLFFHFFELVQDIPLIFSSQSPKFSDLEAHGILISKTWSQQKVRHAARALFWVDQSHFHFLAGHRNGPGLCHPESQPSKYQAELWKYDVAEFFLKSPLSSRYLEFNLAPNGAWWSAAFTAARTPAPGEPSAIPGVHTSSERNPTSWRASARLPLAWLQANLAFSEESTLNATFIINSPTQDFLSAAQLADPSDTAPDFHRPDRFAPIRSIRSLSL